MSDMRRVVDAITDATKTPYLRRRMGTVVSVQADYTITVQIGGSTTNITGVRYFGHYPPTAGAQVWLDTDGKDWVAVGAVAGLGGTLPACKVYRTADQSIPTYTTDYTTVTWQAESFDTSSMWTSGTDVIVPVSGFYQITATASWAGNATSYRTCLVKRGTTTIAYTQMMPGTSTAFQQQTVGICTANTGDAITMLVRQATGGALALNGGNVYETQMVVTYLGPDA